jgi:predicted ATP-grasp superfamily ATP-dependent carboligase
MPRWSRARDRLSLVEAVIKPTVGANGVGVERVRRGHEADAVARLRAVASSPRLLVQEFIPEVAAARAPGCSSMACSPTGSSAFRPKVNFA